MKTQIILSILVLLSFSAYAQDQRLQLPEKESSLNVSGGYISSDRTVFVEKRGTKVDTLLRNVDGAGQWSVVRLLPAGISKQCHYFNADYSECTVWRKVNYHTLSIDVVGETSTKSYELNLPSSFRCVSSDSTTTKSEVFVNSDRSCAIVCGMVYIAPRTFRAYLMVSPEQHRVMAMVVDSTVDTQTQLWDAVFDPNTACLFLAYTTGVAASNISFIKSLNVESGSSRRIDISERDTRCVVFDHSTPSNEVHAICISSKTLRHIRFMTSNFYESEQNTLTLEQELMSWNNFSVHFNPGIRSVVVCSQQSDVRLLDQNFAIINVTTAKVQLSTTTQKVLVLDEEKTCPYLAYVCDRQITIVDQSYYKQTISIGELMYDPSNNIIGLLSIPSGTGDSLLVWTRDGRFAMFDPKNKLCKYVQYVTSVTSIPSVSDDGRYFANNSARAKSWSNFKESFAAGNFCLFGLQSKQVYTISVGRINKCELGADGRVTRIRECNASKLALDHSENTIAYLNESNDVVLCHTQSLDAFSYTIHPVYTVLSMAFSPNSDLLAILSLNGVMELWDYRTNRLVSTFYVDRALSFCFSHDGKSVYIGSEDGRIWKYDCMLRYVRMISQSSFGNILKMCMSTDDQRLYCANTKSEIGIWNLSELPVVTGVDWQVQHVEGAIILGPNPVYGASESVNLRAIELDASDRLDVVNSQGLVLAEYTIPESGIVTLNVENYASGFYCVRLRGHNKFITRSFVVAH